MSALNTTLTLVACLSLSLACSEEGMDGSLTGADGAVGSVPDAALATPADASPPVAVDAAPVQTPPDDFPVQLACSLDDVQPILTCVTDNCLDSIADGTLLTCVTFSCGLLLLTTPPECSQCLLTGLTNPSGALDACVSGLDDLGGGFPLPPAP